MRNLPTPQTILWGKVRNITAKDRKEKNRDNQNDLQIRKKKFLGRENKVIEKR